MFKVGLGLTDYHSDVLFRLCHGHTPSKYYNDILFRYHNDYTYNLV